MNIHEFYQSTLNTYPYLPLAEYPTPLEFLPRLSQELGRTIYIKRDDLIGPGLGGNKTRKLEYLLADAQKRSAKKVVTFGGLQSNHARLTAAAARKLGMEPHLFYFEQQPSHMSGNLLLNELFDAKMHFITLGKGGSMTIERTTLLVHLIAWATVGRHYFIPVGGHNWRGCLGYVRAALEIDQQTRPLGIEKARLVVAAGSGGTLAGLLAGLALVESSIIPLGIDVGKLWKAFPASVAKLANQLCSRLMDKPSHLPAFSPIDVPLVEETYVGPLYGVPSEAGNAAIRQLARLEGILLDPIYTAKAFAGMLDLIRQDKLGDKEPIIFLHTGGIPALFAFDDQLKEKS